MKQQRPFEKGFCSAGYLYGAGLVHAQYHRILPMGRHWNFALQNCFNLWFNLKTFVSTLVQKSRIPSNWDQHFGITCLAYNTCQLLQFTVEVYSKYFESRILNVVLNRRRCVSFEPPPLGNHTWLKLQTMSLQFKASPVLTSFIASTQNVVLALATQVQQAICVNTWKVF